MSTGRRRTQAEEPRYRSTRAIAAMTRSSACRSQVRLIGRGSTSCCSIFRWREESAKHLTHRRIECQRRVDSYGRITSKYWLVERVVGGGSLVFE